MHELSLVRALQSQVRQLAAAHGGGAVQRVRLRVGSLSGYEPALLLSAWNLTRDDAQLPAAVLDIDEVPLEVECQSCRGLFQPLRFRFACPACGSSDTQTVRGEGIILASIELVDSNEGVIL